MLFAFLLLPPLLAAALATVVRPFRPVVAGIGAGLSLVSLGAAGVLWRRVLESGAVSLGCGDVLRADALSTVLALCVSFVAALTAWLGPGLSTDLTSDPRARRRFQIFSNLF